MIVLQRSQDPTQAGATAPSARNAARKSFSALSDGKYATLLPSRSSLGSVHSEHIDSDQYERRDDNQDALHQSVV